MAGLQQQQQAVHMEGKRLVAARWFTRGHPSYAILCPGKPRQGPRSTVAPFPIYRYVHEEV